MIKKVKKPLVKKQKRTKEEILNGQPLLKFNDDVKPKDLAEILQLLYWNPPLRNYYDRSNKTKTYNTKTGREFGNFQRRSRDDAYRTSKFYIPKVNYETIDNATKKLEEQGILTGSYCPTCRKRVYACYKSAIEPKDIRETIGSLNIKINE